MDAPRDKRACRHIETACLRTTRRQFSSGGGARRAIKGWPRFLCTARGRLQVQSASTLAIARDDSALSDAVQCVQRSCARRALAAAVLVHDCLEVGSVRVYYMDRSSWVIRHHANVTNVRTKTTSSVVQSFSEVCSSV